MESKLLAGYLGIKIGVSKVADGNMSLRLALEMGDKAEVDKVKHNRQQFLRSMNIETEMCVSAKLNGHTDKIVLVSLKHAGNSMSTYSDDSVCDGLVTKDLGLGLFMVAADCPIAVYYDPEARVLGMAHFSWITTDKLLPAKMVKFMSDATGSKASNIKVFIGPGIKTESYRIVDPLQKQLASWQKHIKNLPNGETAINLNSYQIEQLVSSGVSRANIELSSVDTAISQDYFSHYRSVRTGEPESRFATVALMN
jgi:polyphenol oxidase